MAESVTVTALRSLDAERVCVALDSGEEIQATLSLVAELRLYRGCTLTVEALDGLRRGAALARWKNRALELLSRRSMSARELRDKLCQKGADEETAARCVRWLEEQRFLDDASYAAAVARHYAAKGYGTGRIQAELRRRGVAKEHWDEALAQRPDNSSKIDDLIARRLRDPSDREQVRKLTAALYRRGFGWDEIREALARFRVEAEEEDKGWKKTLH